MLPHMTAPVLLSVEEIDRRLKEVGMAYDEKFVSYMNCRGYYTDIRPTTTKEGLERYIKYQQSKGI